MFINIVAQLPAAGVGFVVGCFCPAVARKVKSFLTKEATVVKTDVEAAAKKVDAKL
jgi:hypothetical protein